MNIKAFFQEHKITIIHLLGLIGLFLLAVGLTSPLGNFSLNDDWFFARAVHDGPLSTYKLDAFITPVFMGQLFYAKFLTMIFGFGQTMLRLSTVGIACIGVAFLYKLFVARGVKPALGLIACLGLLFHPIFFNVSLSFMSDVPALAFSIAALYFYHAWWKNPRLWLLWIGNFLALYAFIIRQNYVCLFLASFLLIVLQPDKTKRIPALLKSFLPTAVGFAAVYFIFKQLGWWPAQTLTLYKLETLNVLLTNVKQQAFFAWEYLAFFLIPVFLIVWFQYRAKEKIQSLVLAAIGGVTNLALYSRFQLKFPYFDNIWTKYGLGVRTDILSGVPSLEMTRSETLLLSVVAGVASGFMLFFVYSLVRGYRQDREKKFDSYQWFLLAIFGFQLAIVLVFHGFDRYYLSLFVPVLLLVSYEVRSISLKKLGVIGAIGWIGLMGIYSILGTRHYLDLARLKTSIADALVAHEARIDQIDGGYEWSGWNWYHKGDPSVKPYYDPQAPWYMRTLMPDVTRDYVISYSAKKEGYQLIRTYPYKYFFTRTGAIYLLMKEK